MTTPGFATPTENSRRRQDVHESFTSGGTRPRSASVIEAKSAPKTRRAQRKDIEKEEPIEEVTDKLIKEIREEKAMWYQRKEEPQDIKIKPEAPTTFRPLPRPSICGPNPLLSQQVTTPSFPNLTPSYSHRPLETPTFAERTPPSTHFAHTIASPESRGPVPILSFTSPTEDHNKQQLRLPKPDPFAGKPEQDVEEWIQKMELYLRSHKTTEAEAIAFAVQLLKDHAAKWWRATCLHDPRVYKEWGALTSQLRRQYTSPNAATHARTKLSQLRQIRSVAEYVRSFQFLIVDVPNMAVEEALEKFLSGLKPQVQTHVRLHRPHSLEAAIADALIVDDCAMLARTDTPHQSRPSETPTWKSSPQHNEIQVNAVTTKPGKLTEEEKRRCLQERLCFRCRKPGHSSRECNHFQQRT